MEWTWFTWRQHQQLGAQCNSTEFYCAMRLAPRAPQLQPCSPLLPFSRSLSSTGDQLPLPAAPHLCSPPIPTIRRNPLVPLLVFFHLQPSDLRATIRPAAAVAPRNHLGRAQEQAGRRGRELNGWQQCGRDAPARQKPTRPQQRGGKPESWRGASAYQPADCGELNEDEGRNQKSERKPWRRAV